MTPALHRIDVALRHSFGGGFELDFEFRSEARSLAIFGPSGSGKSTVLAAIAGTLRPDAGRIAFDGRTLFDRSKRLDIPPRERSIGLVLQDALLFPLLTVRKNLLFGVPKQAARYSLDVVARMLEIEQLLDRRPRNLSGGEKQRVALGRAILSEPRLLLCDEPFSALDVARRNRLVPILTRVRDELDIPLVLVSHRVREVLAIADDVVIMDSGRIAARGTPSAVLDELGRSEGELPNFWIGQVEEAGRVRVGQQLLFADVDAAHAGRQVRLMIEAESITLASSAPTGQSTRNFVEGHVSALARDGRFVRVELEGEMLLRALVTPAAVHDLSLSIGTRIWALFKASAIDVLSFESHDEA